MNGLSREERELLGQAVAQHRPDLLGLAATVGLRILSEDELEELRQAVLDEFLESGLSKDDEPNSRGRQLERLIDRLRYFSRQADY